MQRSQPGSKWYDRHTDIKAYNAELDARGSTPCVKCPRKYFEQKIYGYADYTIL